MSEYVSCNLCGADDAVLVTDKTRFNNSYRFVKCRKCGLVYMNPRPTQKELTKWYEVNRDCTTNLSTEEYESQFAKRDEERALATCRLNVDGKRILDIGCATGVFLSLMREAGWQVTGIEPHLRYADVARKKGISIVSKRVEDADLPPASYDVISMFSTLEHLADPAGCINRVSQWLRSGGAAIIEVPTLDVMRLRLDREYIKGQCDNWHLYMFSHKTLKALFNRSHLQIVHRRAMTANVVIPVAISASVGRRNSLVMRLLKIVLFRPAYYTLRVIATKVFCIGDLIRVIAIKK